MINNDNYETATQLQSGAVPYYRDAAHRGPPLCSELRTDGRAGQGPARAEEPVLLSFRHVGKDGHQLLRPDIHVARHGEWCGLSLSLYEKISLQKRNVFNDYVKENAMNYI